MDKLILLLPATPLLSALLITLLADRARHRIARLSVGFSVLTVLLAAASLAFYLAEGQPQWVAFAPGCKRIEVGLKTGFSGDHLRRSLNRGPQYRVIQSTSAPEFTVDGDLVRARFDLVTKPSLAGRRVGAHIDETFVIPAGDGLIHHIRASIRPFLTA